MLEQIVRSQNLYACEWQGCKSTFTNIGNFNKQVKLKSHGKKRTRSDDAVLPCEVSSTKSRLTTSSFGKF